MEDEEETEFLRADTWMQSMVPSLPKRCAIFCLVCNVIVPGLGTFTGGVISCCYGRPRLEFRPARYRCPAAFMVMLIGVAQLVCTAFFLVGWLWSIIWGFLMLNLSDPKFRTLAALPPPSADQRAKTPIVKVDQPEEDAPAAKKNFGRLITKARENKDQALGLAAPPPNNSVSSFRGSFLSHIPAIRCSDSKTSTANDPVKTSKRRSDSRLKLLEDSELVSVKVVGALGPALSAQKMFRRWKRAVVSKVPKPGIPCVSGSGSSSEVSLICNRESQPPLSLVAPVTASSRRNSVFSEIISVTPATPLRSRPPSAIGSKTPAIVAPENMAKVNPVVIHVAQSEINNLSSPNVAQVQKENATNDNNMNLGNKSETKVETVAIESKVETELKVNHGASGQKVDLKTTGQKGDVSRTVPKVDQHKPGRKVDPMSKTGSYKADPSRSKLEPKSNPNISVDLDKSGPVMETNKVVAKVGPLSARSILGLTLNPTELFQRQQLKPRMKQSAVYHYDV